MSTTPGMPRSVAAGIVDVVAADPAVRRLVPDVSMWSFFQKAAGSARNFAHMSAEGLAWTGSWTGPGRVAKDYWEQRGGDLACDKIADATAGALHEAIRRERLPKWVTKSYAVHRRPRPENQVRAFHSATGVEVGHGRVYVFDWHATLTRRCPLISRSLDEWLRGDDTFRVLFSVFQGWA